MSAAPHIRKLRPPSLGGFIAAKGEDLSSERLATASEAHPRVAELRWYIDIWVNEGGAGDDVVA